MRYFDARIIENRQLGGGYFVLRLGGCDSLEGSRPGQFVMLRGDWGRDPLLPRAFSLLAVAPAGRADLLLKTVGQGTALLERSTPGTVVSVLGPLGNSFPDPKEDAVDLLVAGGVGLPPLYMQAEHSARCGLVARCEMLYGGRTSRDLVLLGEMRSLGVPLHLATEDGSLGRRGRVTAALDARIDHHRASGRKIRIMACGPNAMLWAVGRIAQQHGIECHLSLEEQMACGIGVCLGCAIPACSRPFRYVCKDGPVFLASEVLDVKTRSSPHGLVPDMTNVALTVTCGGLDFRNPVLTASGTFGYGKEFEGLNDLGAIGGLVTKGISPKPRFGNATPRICETAAGMLNSIGLENVGVEGFAGEKLPYLRTCGTKVIVNFFGTTFDEYVDCGERLARLEGVDALEMNVSCPNIKAGGIEFGTDPRVLGELVKACRAAVRKPLWVKLTPNTSDIVALARACADNGADALSVINTITGMAIDARTRRPKIATIFGGLSGPAIKPIALRMVFQIRRAGVPLPMSGIGGIQSGQDAIEFLLAGATTVQIGTQSFVNPAASERIVREMTEFCRAQGVADVRELIGALRTG